MNNLWGGKSIDGAAKAGVSWIKGAAASDAVQNGAAQVGSAAKKGAEVAGVGLAALLQTIGRGLRFLGQHLLSLMKRSRVALAVVLVAAVLVIAGGVDFVGNWGKAYAGVHVGGVDVFGMTADEIADAVQNEYADRVADTTVTIFANEDAENYVNDTIAQARDRAQADQLSVEQARLNNQLWTTSASELGGSIDYEALAQEALEVGRENGGLGERLTAQFGGYDVDVSLDFDPTQVDHLASDIDDTLGDERIDASVTVSNGYAQAYAGHDGMMVDRTAFAEKIANAIMDTNAEDSFIASVDSAPSRTTLEQAQQLADDINRTISDGANFNYEGTTWTADATTLGDWVDVAVVGSNGSYGYQTSINAGTAKPEILKGVLAKADESPIAVSFSKDADGNIVVNTDGTGSGPDASAAVVSLNAALFGEGGVMESGTTPTDAVSVDVTDQDVPNTMTLDEALDTGVVTAIGTFTTEYSTYAGTESRNHNIHLAADIINNSIAKANGGKWDFNEVAGDCNEERGFESAGTIIDGQYVDNIGGGICQVATTVFNAVFESGLDVVERHNHSLYIASYPDGRDAAVSYPDLDFIWADDTASDVLLQTSYTESSLTVTLYSAPTGYTVTSETSSWVEGEKYGTTTQVDDSLAPGVKYTKTTGADGKSITVTRTVRNAGGDVIKTDSFGSNYEAKDEVVVEGPSS